jgi:translation initiation factor 2 subunit 3
MEQPILNIGMLGSVSDGKSTTVLKLTGTKTQKYSSELKRNITIKPGYANMKIYMKNGEYNNIDGDIVNHLSFIDCPGHYELIITMLSSIKLMDGIILVISAAEELCKKPQLLQHLLAIKLGKFENVIILLNKLDLITKDTAIKRKKELDILLEKYNIKPKIIIPTSMNLSLGLNNLINSIMEYFPPVRKYKDNKPKFVITRSFNINKNNISYNEIKGGVIGGSLLEGEFKVGDEIEIKPGHIYMENNEYKCRTLYSKITSLQSDTLKLDKASTGGLIGIGTNIDPYFTKNDSLAGSVVSLKNTLPDAVNKIKLNIKLNDNKFKLIKDMMCFLQIQSASVKAKYLGDDDFILEKPVCIMNEDMIIISTIINRQFNIIGYGSVL